MRIPFIIILFISIPGILWAKGSLTGTVRDAATNQPLTGAHIKVEGTSIGTITDDAGGFSLPELPNGSWKITASFLGYESQTLEVIIRNNQPSEISFSLSLSALTVREIEITGNRIDPRILNTPMRMEKISADAIMENPGVGVTDILSYISGVNTSSSMGIYDNNTVVTMRGMSGNDQGRTLVLLNGFPLNKSDEGSVNWNLLNRENIGEILITKGPGPARYGSNAMGGVIDIKSRNPEKIVGGAATVEYGTFNTLGVRYSVGGKVKTKKGTRYEVQNDSTEHRAQGAEIVSDPSSPIAHRTSHIAHRAFLYSLDGFYRISDGYNGEIPEYLEPEDTFYVDTKLREAKIGAMLGYQFNDRHQIEVGANFYNDKRGRGVQIYEIDGAHEKHDTWQATLRYAGSAKKWDWEIAGYWFTEGFSRLNEYMSEGEYSLYLVKSRRSDKGIRADINLSAGKSQVLTGGIDVRQGTVYGQDIYYTSTDLITNAGTTESYALYLQDEISLADGRFRINAGLRLNLATFRKGLFTAEYPSYSIEYLQAYTDTLIPDHTWTDIDPKLSFQYRFGAENRIYVSFAKGFRAPNLDDLCRTGRRRGGFKIANPALNPENLYNIETGADVLIAKQVTISPSIYYSIGSDFMYYVATGDSVNLGYKLDPIYQKQNISRVDIYGLDIDISWSPVTQLELFANYSYGHSVIARMSTSDTLTANDLTGKHLTDVPANKASAGITWTNKYVNTKILWKFVGKRWINDLNEPDEYLGYAQFPAYNTFSFRLWHTFWKRLTVAVNVDNLFDERFVTQKILLSPGRVISAEVTFRL